MVEPGERDEQPSGGEAEAQSERTPALSPVERRMALREKTRLVLLDADWPGDGALGPRQTRSAMWWCVGGTLLLLFPRQYWAALGLAALALVFYLIDRRHDRKRPDAPQTAADPAEPAAGRGSQATQQQLAPPARTQLG